MSTVLEVEAPREAARPTTPRSDEPLYEVVNGERVELPEMSIYANLIAGRVKQRLDEWTLQSPTGVPAMEALFILDSKKDLRRRPDVAWVSFEAWPSDREIPETGDWEVVPTLAVEVVSPNDIMHEVLGKMREYFRYGAAEVWIIVPEEQVLYRYHSPLQVEIIPDDGEMHGEPLLPGFRLRMADLMQRKFAVAAPSTVASAEAPR